MRQPASDVMKRNQITKHIVCPIKLQGKEKKTDKFETTARSLLLNHPISSSCQVIFLRNVACSHYQYLMHAFA